MSQFYSISQHLLPRDQPGLWYIYDFETALGRNQDEERKDFNFSKVGKNNLCASTFFERQMKKNWGLMSETSFLEKQ